MMNKKILTVLFTILILISSAGTVNTVKADDFSDEEETEILYEEEILESEEGEGETFTEEENEEPVNEEIIEEEPVIETETEEPENTEEETEEETEVEIETESEESEVYYGYKQPEVDTSYFVSEESDIELNNLYLPSRYNLDWEYYDTPVKDQSYFGTCWAFAAVGSAETTYKKSTGQTLDLSELHLAYFFYDSYNFTDPLNSLDTSPIVLIDGDGNEVARNEDDVVTDNIIKNTLWIGGNSYDSTFMLASGMGFQNESDFDYFSRSKLKNKINNYFSNLATSSLNLTENLCFSSKYSLRECKWYEVSAANRQAIKEAVYRYGGVAVGICGDGEYLDDRWYTIYCDEAGLVNHEVVIVGWDDNYSHNQFKRTENGNLPAGDGAWIVKNSLGEDDGMAGYFYVSYYDAAMNSAENVAVQLFIEETPEGEYIYQHDGSPYSVQKEFNASTVSEAAIYYTRRDEMLNRIGFYTGAADTEVNIKVYANGNSNTNPASGECLFNQSITCDDAGYHTLELEDFLYFEMDTRFSVVITYERTNGNVVSILDEANDDVDYEEGFKNHSSTDDGLTFVKVGNESWNDYNDYTTSKNYTARIKAFTTPAAESEYTNGELTIDLPESAADILSSVTSITIGTRTIPSSQFRRNLTTNSIIVDQVTLLEYNVWDGLYRIFVNVPGQESLAAGKIRIRLNDNETPEYSILKSNNYLIIYSEDSDWVTNMGRKKESGGNVIFRYEDLQIDLTPDDYTVHPQGNTHDPNGIYDPCIQIPMSVILEKLPGVEDRYYMMYLDAYGYPAAISAYYSSGHTAKEGDILYITVDAGEGVFEDATSTKTFKVVRGQALNITEYPAKLYCTVSGFLDAEDNPVNINCIVGNNDRTIYTQYEYSQKVKEVTTNYTTEDLIPDDSEAELSTITPLSTIYYRYEEMDNYMEYTGPISLSIDHAIYENGNYCVRVYAYASREDYESSDECILDYHVYDASIDSWGEIEEEDQVGFTYASCVPAGLWVSNLTDVTFDPIGNTHKASSFNVYYHKTKLVNGKDYQLKYENNSKAGQAKITITAKGNYTGSLVTNYTIEPIRMDESEEITVISSRDYFKYNGKAQKPTLKVKYGSKTLTLNKDYVLKYDSDDSYKEIGMHAIQIVGKGNYTGTYVYTYDITQETPVTSLKYTISSPTYDYESGLAVYPTIIVKDGKQTLIEDVDYVVDWLDDSASAGSHTCQITGHGDYIGKKTISYVIKGISISKWKVKDLVSSYRYEPNEAIEPEIRVCKDDRCSIVLEKDQDYSITYTNNQEIGTASMVIQGINGYTGTIKKTFKIVGEDISKYQLILSGDSFDYINQDIAPLIEVKLFDKEGQVISELSYEDEDYEITYSNNRSVGTATVLVKGLNGYTGSIKKTFKINAISLNDATRIEARIDSANVSYSKSKTENSFTIKDLVTGDILESGKDYKVTYKNNTKPGTATATIKGMGNYTGTLTYKYTIVKQDISNLSITAKDIVATNKKGVYTTSVKVTDVNGKTLVKGTDYTLAYFYAEETTLANGRTRIENEPVNSSDIVPAGTTLKVSATGKGYYTGILSDAYYVGASDFTKITASITDQVYTGKAITLNKKQIVLKLNNYELSNEDYEIVSFANNISAGTASVTLKGLGNYVGTKKVTFRIVSRPISSIIIYNGNSTLSGKMKNQKVVENTTTLNTNTYTKKGYRFLGWNTLSNGKGIPYEDGATVNLKDGETLVLYAQWEIETYDIHYELNDGFNGSNNPDTYRVNSSTIKLENAQKEGYNFKGWYSDSSFKNKVTKISYGSTGERTLYAKFTPVTYSISFGSGSGKGKMSALTGKHYTDTYTLPKCKFVREGYTFYRWKYVINSRVYYYRDLETITKLPIMDSDRAVFNAIWSPNEYTVHYDANGGSINQEILDDTAYYDESFTLSNGDGFSSGNSAIRLVGWNTKADGSGHSYSLEESVKNLTTYNGVTVTLYAEWSIPTPVGLETETLYQCIGLNWSAIGNDDEGIYYNIYRKEGKGAYSLIGQTMYTAILDNTVDISKSGKTYSYKVTACYGGNESLASTVATGRTSYLPQISDSYLKQEKLKSTNSSLATLYLCNDGPVPLTVYSVMDSTMADAIINTQGYNALSRYVVMYYHYDDGETNAPSDAFIYSIKTGGRWIIFSYDEDDFTESYDIQSLRDATIKIDIDPQNRNDLHNIESDAAAVLCIKYDNILYGIRVYADTRRKVTCETIYSYGDTGDMSLYHGHYLSSAED